MAKAPPALFAWLGWFFLFSGAIILLGGVSASQRFCGRSSANSLTVSGGSGYFAPISCDNFYRYTWWITWYTITMAVIVPVVLAMGAVHKWRLGLVFLLVPLTYMLMQTTNSLFLQKDELASDRGPSRAAFAGALIGSVACYLLIIVLGVRDEQPQVVEEQ